MSDEEKKVVQNTEDVFENSSVAENATEQEASSSNSPDDAQKAKIKPFRNVSGNPRPFNERDESANCVAIS